MAERRSSPLSVELYEDRIAPAVFRFERMPERRPDDRPTLAAPFHPERVIAVEPRPIQHVVVSHPSQQPDRFTVHLTDRPEPITARMPRVIESSSDGVVTLHPRAASEMVRPIKFAFSELAPSRPFRPVHAAEPADQGPEPELPPPTAAAIQLAVSRGTAAVRRAVGATPGMAADLYTTSESTPATANAAVHDSPVSSPADAPQPTGALAPAVGTMYFVSATSPDTIVPPADPPTPDETLPEPQTPADPPAKPGGFSIQLPVPDVDPLATIGELLGVPLAGAMTVDLAAVESGASALLSSLSDLADDLTEAGDGTAEYWMLAAVALAAGAGYAAFGGTPRRLVRPGLVPDSFLARRGVADAV